MSTNITCQRIDTLRTLVEDYMKDKLSEIELIHFGDVNTVMKIFKDMYNQLEVDKSACMKDAYDKAMEDFITKPKLEKRISNVSAKVKLCFLALYLFF